LHNSGALLQSTNLSNGPRIIGEMRTGCLPKLR